MFEVLAKSEPHQAPIILEVPTMKDAYQHHPANLGTSNFHYCQVDSCCQSLIINRMWLLLLLLYVAQPLIQIYLPSAVTKNIYIYIDCLNPI